jgi:GT2 family glycosyltransferase
MDSTTEPGAARDDSVSAVVVGYSDPVATAQAVESLLGQSRPPLEVLVVDNDEASRVSAELARRRFGASVRIVSAGRNWGYTRAVNLAAEAASGSWLFFLNPDAVAEPDCTRLMLEAARDPGTAIVGAQVLLPDGRVNAGDNPISLSGVSWSGRYGEPREEGPAREAAAVSGAALMVRRDVFAELGGLCPDFFLYQDDSDLAWRARLAGWQVRYCPAAAVVHDFEFERGAQKWFYLERNRGWAVLSNLAPATLALVSPVLLSTELAVTMRAAREGWLGAKLRAWASLLRSAPRIRRWRRSVQSRRRVSDREVLELFRGGVETDLLDSSLLRIVNPWLERYRRALLAILARGRST